MEKSSVDKLAEEVMECICDDYCKFTQMAGSQLEEKCENCKIEKMLARIREEYNRLNDFDNSQSAKLLVKISEKDAEIAKLKALEVSYAEEIATN